MIGLLSALAQASNEIKAFFEENGFERIEECHLFPIPVRAGVKTSGTSSTVSVVKSGTPKTLTMLLPATGLFGSSSSNGISLTMYENGFK